MYIGTVSLDVRAIIEAGLKFCWVFSFSFCLFLRRFHLALIRYLSQRWRLKKNVNEQNYFLLNVKSSPLSPPLPPLPQKKSLGTHFQSFSIGFLFFKWHNQRFRYPRIVMYISDLIREREERRVGEKGIGKAVPCSDTSSTQTHCQSPVSYLAVLLLLSEELNCLISNIPEIGYTKKALLLGI